MSLGDLGDFGGDASTTIHVTPSATPPPKVPFLSGGGLYSGSGTTGGSEGSASRGLGFIGEDALHDERVLFALVLVLMCGSVFVNRLSHVPVPYTVLMFLFGIFLGFLSLLTVNGTEIFGTISGMASAAPPRMLLHIFLPILIFEGSFGMRTFAVQRVIGTAAMLAGPGMLLNAGMIACTVRALWSWSWLEGLLLGAVLSATDPVAVVALLKGLGVEPCVTAVIDAEALMNDGTAIIMFNVLIPAVSASSRGIPYTVEPSAVAVTTLNCIVGAVALGIAFFLCLKPLLMSSARNDMSFVLMGVGGAFAVFFIADAVCETSGVLTLFTLGVILARQYPSRFPGHHQSICHETWSFLVHTLNTIIFCLVGILVVRLMWNTLSWWSVYSWFVIYAVALVSRFAVLYACHYAVLGINACIRVFSSHVPPIAASPRGSPSAVDNNVANVPLLWEMSREQLLLCWHGGLRGGVAVILTLVTISDGALQPERAAQFLNLVFGVVVFTLLVNATTAPRIVERLRLHAKPLHRVLHMGMAVRALTEHTRALIGAAKHDPALQGAHFPNVEYATVDALRDPFADTPVIDEPAEVLVPQLLTRCVKNHVWHLRDSDRVSEHVIRRFSASLASLPPGRMLDISDLVPIALVRVARRHALLRRQPGAVGTAEATNRPVDGHRESSAVAGFYTGASEMSRLPRRTLIAVERQRIEAGRERAAEEREIYGLDTIWWARPCRCVLPPYCLGPMQRWLQARARREQARISREFYGTLVAFEHTLHFLEAAAPHICQAVADWSANTWRRGGVVATSSSDPGTPKHQPPHTLRPSEATVTAVAAGVKAAAMQRVARWIERQRVHVEACIAYMRAAHPAAMSAVMTEGAAAVVLNAAQREVGRMHSDGGYSQFDAALLGDVLQQLSCDVATRAADHAAAYHDLCERIAAERAERRAAAAVPASGEGGAPSAPAAGAAREAAEPQDDVLPDGTLVMRDPYARPGGYRVVTAGEVFRKSPLAAGLGDAELADVESSWREYVAAPGKQVLLQPHDVALVVEGTGWCPTQFRPVLLHRVPPSGDGSVAQQPSLASARGGSSGGWGPRPSGESGFVTPRRGAAFPSVVLDDGDGDDGASDVGDLGMRSSDSDSDGGEFAHAPRRGALARKLGCGSVWGCRALLTSGVAHLGRLSLDATSDDAPDAAAFFTQEPAVFVTSAIFRYVVLSRRTVLKLLCTHMVRAGAAPDAATWAQAHALATAPALLDAFVRFPLTFNMLWHAAQHTAMGVLASAWRMKEVDLSRARLLCVTAPSRVLQRAPPAAGKQAAATASAMWFGDAVVSLLQAAGALTPQRAPVRGGVASDTDVEEAVVHELAPDADGGDAGEAPLVESTNDTLVIFLSGSDASGCVRPAGGTTPFLLPRGATFEWTPGTLLLSVPRVGRAPEDEEGDAAGGEPPAARGGDTPHRSRVSTRFIGARHASPIPFVLRFQMNFLLLIERVLDVGRHARHALRDGALLDAAAIADAAAAAGGAVAAPAPPSHPTPAAQGGVASAVGGTECPKHCGRAGAHSMRQWRRHRAIQHELTRFVRHTLALCARNLGAEERLYDAATPDPPSSAAAPPAHAAAAAPAQPALGSSAPASALATPKKRRALREGGDGTAHAAAHGAWMLFLERTLVRLHRQDITRPGSTASAAAGGALNHVRAASSGAGMQQQSLSATPVATPVVPAPASPAANAAMRAPLAPCTLCALERVADEAGVFAREAAAWAMRHFPADSSDGAVVIAALGHLRAAKLQRPDEAAARAAYWQHLEM